MTIEKIREFHSAVPFRPFALHLADGRQLLVDRPEFLARAPSGQKVLWSNYEDTFDWVELSQIKDVRHVNVRGNGSRNRRKRKRGGDQ